MPLQEDISGHILEEASAQYFIPISAYERNLFTDVRANPVMGPVVSSDRMTSRKGRRKTLGSISVSSVIKQTKVIIRDLAHQLPGYTSKKQFL